MWPNPQETANLVTFLKKSLMENLIFCKRWYLQSLYSDLIIPERFLLWQRFIVSSFNSHLNCTWVRISSVITAFFLTLWGTLSDNEPTSITSTDYSWWVGNCKTNEFEIEFSIPRTSEACEVSTSISATTLGMSSFFFPLHNRSYWFFHFCKINSCMIILSHHFSMTPNPVGVWIFPFFQLSSTVTQKDVFLCDFLRCLAAFLRA